MDTNMFAEIMRHAMMESFAAATSSSSPEPPKLTCPLCKEAYVYQQGDTSCRLAERCSHQARLVYCKHSCSICLDDYENGVALKCGHIFCVEDFCKLGGRMGQDSMKCMRAIMEEEAEKRRAEMEEEGFPGMPDGFPGGDFQSFLQAMMGSGIVMTPDGPRMVMPPGEYDSGDDDDYDEYHDDDDDDYEEDDDEDDDEDASTDSEMPPLLNADGTMPGAASAAASDSGDDDSSMDSLPPLVPRDQVAPSNNNVPSASNNNNNYNAAARNNNASSTSNNNNNRPSVAVQGVPDGTSSDDDDDSLPALIPRNQATGIQNRSAATNTNINATNNNDAGRSSNNNIRNNASSNNNTSGNNNNRSNARPPAVVTVGNNNDDDDDDSDASIPPLLHREAALGADKKRDDEDDDDDDSGPLPLEHRQHSMSSSDDDSVPRGAARGRDAADYDSDDSSAPPPLVTRIREDSSDDDDSVPGLLHRNDGARTTTSAAGARTATAPAPAATTVGDDSGDESDGLPPLIQREQLNTKASSSAPQRQPVYRRNAAASAPASSAPTKSYDEVLVAAREKAKKMKPSQLKNDLRKWKVNIEGMIEKSELVEAHAKESTRRSMGRNAPAETAPRSTPEPPRPPPVDPLADLPALLPNVDPSENGVWIRTPMNASVDELQYVFPHCRELRTQNVNVVLDKGYSYSVFASYDGYAYLHAQPDKGGGKHEVHVVHCTDVANKIYDIDAADFEMMPCGVGSLYMLYPENESDVESTWKLVYRSRRNQKPQTLLRNIPFSSRMHTCSSGFVWLDVGRGGASGSLKPGLWHVSRWNSKHVLTADDIPEDHENRFVTIDAERDGMWVLRPEDNSDGSTCVLIHVDKDGQKRLQTLKVSFNTVQAVVNAGKQRDGVFIHYKVLDRWKLGLATMGKAVVEDYCDCARGAQLSSCGQGGVWIWKKAGRQRTQTLSYVDAEKVLREFPKSFHKDAELVAENSTYKNF